MPYGLRGFYDHPKLRLRGLTEAGFDYFINGVGPVDKEDLFSFNKADWKSFDTEEEAADMKPLLEKKIAEGGYGDAFELQVFEIV